jgi:hypothetical protein
MTTEQLENEKKYQSLRLPLKNGLINEDDYNKTRRFYVLNFVFSSAFISRIACINSGNMSNMQFVAVRDFRIQRDLG